MRRRTALERGEGPGPAPAGTANLPKVFARSAGGQALRRIRGSAPRAHVLSSYRGALNLITRGGLVSVVPREAGRGPLSINVDGATMERLWPLQPDERAEVTPGAILFPGRLELLLNGAEVYDPSPRFVSPPLPRPAIIHNLEVAKGVTLREGHLEGMGDLISLLDGKDPFEPNRFTKAALPHVRALLSSIKTGDLPGVRKASRHMIGLGIGLTPSGDDLLSGLMVAMVLGSRNGIGQRGAGLIASRMVQGRRGLTTRLSFEYLQEASKGRANERVESLAKGILTQGEREVASATLAALSIGETSGTDTIVGVCLGVQAIIAG